MGPIEKELRDNLDDLKEGSFVFPKDQEFCTKHNIKSIKSYSKLYSCDSYIYNILVALLDELEEEHKTEIPQPVDADGVPWTGEDIDKEFINWDGDEHKIEKIYYNLAHKKWYIKYSEKYVDVASYCRHVKPKRSLEEIARDIDEAGLTSCWAGVLFSELHQYFADDAGDKS